MIEAAFRAHRREPVEFARRHDGPAAEEVVQETFLRAWRSRHRFDPGAGTVRMWLFAICRNVTCDARRAQIRRSRTPALFEPGAPAPDHEAAERLVASEHVGRALGRLPRDQREAILLVHGHGRPYADVAAHLGVPVGTVKSRVHLGLRSARSALADVA